MAASLSQFRSYQKIPPESSSSEPLTARKKSRFMSKLILIVGMTLVIILAVLLIGHFSSAIDLDKVTDDSKRDQVVDDGCE